MTTSATFPALLMSIVLLPLAQPARAQSADPADSAEPNAGSVRKIVRVVTTGDDSSEVEVESRRQFVFEDGETPFGRAFARKRGFLGVQLLDLTPELRSHFGATPEAGVMVSKVLADSPASASGLRPGDILLALDAEPLESVIELERRVSPLEDQTDVTLEILRDGARRKIPVTIVERERPTIDLGRLALAAPGEVHGFEWRGPGEIERHVIHIDPEGLDEALRELEVRIEQPGFVERFGAFGESRLDLQRRIQELERRLESLESQLEELSGD